MSCFDYDFDSEDDFIGSFDTSAEELLHSVSCGVVSLKRSHVHPMPSIFWFVLFQLLLVWACSYFSLLLPEFLVCIWISVLNFHSYIHLCYFLCLDLVKGSMACVVCFLFKTQYFSGKFLIAPWILQPACLLVTWLSWSGLYFFLKLFF